MFRCYWWSVTTVLLMLRPSSPGLNLEVEIRWVLSISSKRWCMVVHSSVHSIPNWFHWGGSGIIRFLCFRGFAMTSVRDGLWITEVCKLHYHYPMTTVSSPRYSCFPIWTHFYSLLYASLSSQFSQPLFKCLSGGSWRSQSSSTTLWWWCDPRGEIFRSSSLPVFLFPFGRCTFWWVCCLAALLDYLLVSFWLLGRWCAACFAGWWIV